MGGRMAATEVPMAVTTVNISLPRELKDQLDREVSRGSYGSASEFVRDALRAAFRRGALERLEELVLEGLASPERTMTAASWKALRARARRADREARRR